MKTEDEIRKMIAILEWVSTNENPANVLRWVLDEYPPEKSAGGTSPNVEPGEASSLDRSKTK